MLIESLLGYKSTWRILNLLLETPRKPVSRVELFKFTKLGNAPLSRGLERLVRAGILILEKRGKKEYYYVNESNEDILLIKQLWQKERQSLRNLPYEITLILSEFVRGINDLCQGVNSIILFGSQAKGTASIHSDIDLALIFEEKVEELPATKVVQKIKKQFGKEIQLHFFTVKTFAGKSKLLKEIKEEGIRL